MQIFYEILGMQFDVIFDDEIDMYNILCNLPGRVSRVEIQPMAKIEFKNVAEECIKKYIENSIFDDTRTVLVEPTGDISEILYSEGKMVCTYNRYYYVEYYFTSHKIQFYYTDRFFSIAQLLPEFFKYYIFKSYVGQGMFPIHSSCIKNKKNNKNILLVGESGSGKSSIALYASLTEDFYFGNDEITYVSIDEDDIVSHNTNDLIKICQEMFGFLAKDRVVEYKVTTDNELLCDVDFLREGICADICSEIEAIYLLNRNDNLSSIEIRKATLIESYEYLLNNSNVSIWTDICDKKSILNMISCLVKRIEINVLEYPLFKIGEIHGFLHK